MSDSPGKALDFALPLEALKACHVRIRSNCETLRDLLLHMNDHGCDARARESASDVMRFFDTTARLHHEDEEDDLLPRMMMATTVNRGSRLTRLVADIANEHREMEKVWIELRAVLQEISAGEDTQLDPLTVDRYVKLYKAHLAMEESNVIPLAEMLLSGNDIAEISSSMMARRGLTV
jgi:hemerythrin-like domain-containing protein